MDNQLQEDRGPTIHFPGLLMAEASPQLCLEADNGEVLLEQHQPREGCQGLVLESEFRNLMGFTIDFRSAKLHLMDLFGLRC